jgi:CBS domain-containing protein
MMTHSNAEVDDDLEEPDLSDPGQIPISVLANDRIVQATPDVTIREAAKQLADEGIGLLVLSDDSGVCGVVSERDIVRAVASEVHLDARVTAVASAGAVQWASSNSSIADVANEMMRSWLRHILIADDDGNLVGIVSMRDLLAAIV